MSGKLSLNIAVTALILMLAAILANAVYVKNTADHILTLIDSDGSPDTSATIISEYWNKRIPILRLSLSQKELEDISLEINDAIICAEDKETEEYKRSMARLRRAIESIKKREEFSLENIL